MGLRPGLLERLAGIRERRWWPDGVTFVDGAAMAGAKAISESGVDPAEIGLMINTSVSRKHLEPSTAVAVHHALGLPSSCQNFDVTNACLGFVNGMELAAAMIDSGQVDYALVVNGEDARPVQERTIDRLNRPETTAKDVMAQFATLTLGSGAAPWCSAAPTGTPRATGWSAAVSRAGTEHHELCVGDNDGMQTDLKGLLDAGPAAVRGPWAEAAPEFDWAGAWTATSSTRSPRCTPRPCASGSASTPHRVPRTFPTRGNIGPASVPFTLAGAGRHAGRRRPGAAAWASARASTPACLEIAW